MSLQYIMGGPSSGKTKFCIDKILEFGTDENILLIVPEQFSLQAEKELIKLKGAIVNTQVLSFQRLSFYIFSELGGVNKILLEDIGKNILLRKILSHTQLNFFVNSCNQGFIDSLSSMISEFYKYEISLSDLDNYIEFASDDLKIKMQDLYLVYKEYSEYIKEKYLSLDETLDILADKIHESKYLNGIKIFMDGFDSFNPQEYKVINELMKVAGDIFFTAGIHLNQGHGMKYLNPIWSDPYFEIKNTVNNITELAQINGLEIKNPISLRKAYKENYELEFLSNNYFYFYAQEYSQPAENIFLYSANDLYDEINFIAKKIINYVRNGMRFNQIAIVVGNLEEYANQIERIFSLYSIPYFIDTKVSIMTNRIVEFIRAAFGIIIYNFSYESVFRFLKTDLLDIDLDDIDLIEDYVLEFGIKGKLWKNDWHFGFNKYDEKEIIRIKNLVLEKTDFLSENLSVNRKYEVSWLCKFIFDMLNHFDLENKLNENSEENLKVWAKICEVLDKIVDILSGTKVDILEFVSILDEGLKKIDLGLIPQFSDQIIIGDIERSRIPNVKVLFIAGANEGYLPKSNDEINLFSNDEKMFLKSVGMKFAPDMERKIFKSDFLLYGLLSKPSYQLNISCSLKNSDEKQMYPANVFNKIKKLFPYGSKNVNNDISLPSAMLNDIVKIIYNKNPDDYQIQIYNWFRNNNEYEKKILKFENVALKNNAGSLKIACICDKINISVTQLESYAKCPFAHFLKYDLKLKKRKIYTLKSVDIGSFLHAALKQFFLIVKNKNVMFECRDNLKFYIDEAIKECDFDENIFYESAYYKFLLYHIKNVLYASISAMLNDIESEKYIPDEFEFEFSNIKLADKIFLNGKIDRIDILKIGNEKYLRVIDYKSSEKKISQIEVESGVQLQLLLYLKILLDDKIKPGGAFYFHLDNPFIDLKNEIDDLELRKKINDKFKLVGTKIEKIDELIETACYSAKNIGDEILNGNIDIKPHDKFSCLYCPYSCVCQKKQVFYAD